MTVAGSERYREIANAVRSLIPLMEYEEVRAQLRLLAARYERLAKYLQLQPDQENHPEGRDKTSAH